jgi:glycosyltransferase involved in cell wall biosynthesis
MLTVLIPTHNGAQTLPQVLGAFCKLVPPPGGWRLVVVDNGSTDRTRDIVMSFRSSLPLAYVFEPRLGKSFAQNTGLGKTAGELVVFTDDDALPKSDWLLQLRLAADSQPSFSIFGGSIVPHWATPPENWILKLDGSILAITDPTWEEGPIPAPRIYGPNMAVRSEILAAGYTFNTSLGPVGSCYRMGEDTDFLQRIGQAGYKAWYCKKAVVAHMISRDQMTKTWVLRRAVPLGRANYRREFRDSPMSPALLLGIPRYILREILTRAVRLGCAKFSKDADAVFLERWQLSYLVGRAIEGRILAATPNAEPTNCINPTNSPGNIGRINLGA